jgi:hypothetical protein
LASGALVALLLAAPARAQQTGEAGAEAAEGGGEAETEAYQFNLAPAKTAPGAIAEILLTPRPDGGYAAEMAAMSLPEPAALKPDATTYVVWIYDPATKKKQRVAALTPEAGAGTANFDVLWPKFALVVTAEPSIEPKEWSGVAVLTGQPTVPENPGPATEAALAAPPAEAAPPADAAASAPGATDSATAAQAGGAAPSADAAAAAGAPGAEVAGAAAAPGADAAAGVPDTGAAAATPPSDVATAAGAADAGASGPTAVSAAPDSAAAPCVNAPQEDEKKSKKKKRFSNPALDAMAAAQKHGEEGTPCPPAEE